MCSIDKYSFLLNFALVAMLVLGGAASMGTALAEEDATEQPAGEAKKEDADEITATESIEVRAEAPRVQIEKVDISAMHAGFDANLANAATAVPGVAGVRRSQDGVDPVVRGLGRERIQTQYNGLPLNHSCPARMDPPSTVISSASVHAAEVVKGLASVTDGPGGTGGRLLVSTDYDRGTADGSENHPWVRTSYNGARDGYTFGAGIDGGSGAFDYSAGLETLQQGNYTSADGTEVPANQDETGAHATIGHRPGEAHRWTLGGVYRKGENLDFPSLPMNTDRTTTRMFNGTYRYGPKNGSSRAPVIEARLGYATIDHLMSNRGKPNRPMMEAETESYSDSAGAGLSARWGLSGRSTLEVGADYSGLSSDALRQRTMVMSGMTTYDHLWPDVSQDDIGLFAEYGLGVGSGWQLRFGARYDAVTSQAAAADDPGMGGRTIRENYVRFYGPEAANTDRDEDLWSANALFTREFSRALTMYAGVGMVQRPAAMTERYFAFAPAPGGFTVGNPTLDAERKREVSAGLRFENKVVYGSVSLYYYSIGDYIKDTTLGWMDMNGDGIDDRIRGFENVDARLTGGEITAVFKAGSRFTIPTSLFYVRGEYGSEDNPLPEIPPLDGRAAARMTYGKRNAGWVELGGRFVAQQDRVDPDFPTTAPPTFTENPTPGFAVWHLRASFPLHRTVNLEIGVENLFDKEYWEHLTRETFLPVGDLARGQEIPQPGRWVFVGFQFRL
jgi:iron complex outermembrane receptor protein